MNTDFLIKKWARIKALPDLNTILVSSIVDELILDLEQLLREEQPFKHSDVYGSNPRKVQPFELSHEITIVEMEEQTEVKCEHDFISVSPTLKKCIRCDRYWTLDN